MNLLNRFVQLIATITMIVAIVVSGFFYIGFIVGGLGLIHEHFNILDVSELIRLSIILVILLFVIYIFLYFIKKTYKSEALSKRKYIGGSLILHSLSIIVFCVGLLFFIVQCNTNSKLVEWGSCYNDGLEILETIISFFLPALILYISGFLLLLKKSK